MIKKLIYTLTLAVIIFSCNNAEDKNPVTGTDVATTFIRAVLDNDFKTAKQYLLIDETNKQYFESFQHMYQQKNESELLKYKNADIIINTIEPKNDTTIVNYSNSYEKNTKTKLKLIRSNGQWLVDLKYTFAENQ
jgi:hypothetical protein